LGNRFEVRLLARGDFQNPPGYSNRRGAVREKNSRGVTLQGPIRISPQLRSPSAGAGDLPKKNRNSGEETFQEKNGTIWRPVAVRRKPLSTSMRCSYHVEKTWRGQRGFQGNQLGLSQIVPASPIGASRRGTLQRNGGEIYTGSIRPLDIRTTKFVLSGERQGESYDLGRLTVGYNRGWKLDRVGCWAGDPTCSERTLQGREFRHCAVIQYRPDTAAGGPYRINLPGLFRLSPWYKGTENIDRMRIWMGGRPWRLGHFRFKDIPRRPTAAGNHLQKSLDQSTALSNNGGLPTSPDPSPVCAQIWNSPGIFKNWS